MAIKFAVYKVVNNCITKDGYTMMPDDLARDLNRKSHLEGARLTLVARIAKLKKDIAFLQSCVNSGETATKADRPSERSKAIKAGV